MINTLSTPRKSTTLDFKLMTLLPEEYASSSSVLPYIVPDEKMAAPDTKVCSSIRSKADCEKVQQALANIE